jgi:uncharacterized protein (DUF433 family)
MPDQSQPLGRHLATPLYSITQAARILSMPPSSLRNWAAGYPIQRPSDRRAFASPLITTEPHRQGSRATVPFVGLAEAHTLQAFRAAGVPVQRIRPAITWLKEHLGLAQALASERLMTDGAEVLYDFATHTDDAEAREAVDGLVVVRSGQQVFRQVVRDYLSGVEFRDGWISLIHLPNYDKVDVTVNPCVNGSRPTVTRRGIPLDTILGRLRGGEAASEVAADYRLTRSEISALQAPA